MIGFGNENRFRFGNPWWEPFHQSFEPRPARSQRNHGEAPASHISFQQVFLAFEKNAVIGAGADWEKATTW
jgi:hypothetical protein